VLVRHKADPSVEVAWIGAIATVLGVTATAAVAIFAFWYSRSTNQATIKDQGKQLDRTLAEQREQLDRTLAEQREQLGQTLAAQREQLDKTLAAQREQLDKTLAAQREQLDSTLTRTLNERFATAAGQLGSDKPPAVRLAGVYAMAGLADDWEENRQTCVDVLCGYLRMPYEPDPGQEAPGPERLDFRASREVRHTVIRVIAAHLRDGAAVSWQGLSFDFTGIFFDGGNFSGARFSGGTVSFIGAEFSGSVMFIGAEFSDGTVSFYGAEFSGGIVCFDTAKFSGGNVSFRSAKYSGGTVSFADAEFSGSTVSFYEAEFSGGLVRFNGAEFSGGSRVGFGGAEFSGGAVTFDGAQFSGGTVDYSHPGDWSHPPAFPWTGTPPPGVKLPEKDDQSQAQASAHIG
jgi:hypothetical protein